MEQPDQPSACSLDWLLDSGLDPAQAERLARALACADRVDAPLERWALVCREGLEPSFAASVHERVYRHVYRDWPSDSGPPPAWIPPPDITTRSNLGRLIDRLGLRDVERFRQWAIDDRPGFWRVLAETLTIAFDEPWTSILDPSEGFERPRWFPGSRMNITRSCFQQPPDTVAIVEHSEVGPPRQISYGALESLTNQVANGLQAAGIRPGDAVGVMLPLTIEAVAILLGTIRAGGVVIGIPESFATPEIALRLRLGRARVMITQDQIVRRGQRLPLLAKLDPIEGLARIVICTEGTPALRPETDRTWTDFLSPDTTFDPVSLPPEAHAVILFSSGTTGEPKAIPWSHTTPIKCAADGWLYHDIQPGDVVAWPSSMGWMMGPWLVFATLINGGTIALYEGHPGTEGFCRFVQDAGVTILGVVPSLVAAWRAGGWPSCFDWTRIKAFGSTGECSRPDDMRDLMSRAGYKPVIEYCGGTEIGGGYLTSTMLRPNAPSCFNTVAFGIELDVRDPAGEPAARGEAFLIGPSIGLSTELLNRDHHATYFADTPPHDPPLRRHGDQVACLPDGFFRVLGRVDDTMNLGGIKISAVEIEQVLEHHPLVRESAAVASNEDGGPDRLVAYVVPEGVVTDLGALRKELQSLLNGRLNPLFRLSEVVLVEQLPRTASNKLMRRLLRDEPGSGKP
ncbi:MAG: AMP-binding protein [Isosphaeraceae bacterium]